MKWFAPILAYLAVGLGMFEFHSAWGGLLAFHAVILISLWIAKPKIPLQVLWTSSDFRWILASIFICGSAGITLYFLWDQFGIANDISMQVERMGLSGSGWIVFIAYFTLVNPLIEEYFWRGFLGSPTRDLYISDFLYSGFHGLILMRKVQPDVIVYCLAVLVLAGWFWRQMARADRGLLAPVLGHMAADFTILMAIFLKV